jgi:hypothetical protein
VGRLEDLQTLAARGDRPRVVLEGLTSMCRHGFTPSELGAGVAEATRGVRVEGRALHLPLGDGHVDEVERWLSAAPAATWYVSHLRADELRQLSRAHPDVAFRPRVGTDLWLGDRAALVVRATVLDAHQVSRGDRVGYRQRHVMRAGTVLVVSGGTSHGIGLESPTPAVSSRQRARALAIGGMQAAGLALSPYVVAGKQRWFVEPPHMQVSMIHVPAGDPVPAVGDAVEVQVRFTTTTFDRVHIT